MVKVTRFRPTESGVIRIECDITPRQLQEAALFRPEVLVLRETKKDTQVYQVVLNRNKTTFGQHGAHLNIDPENEENILLTHQCTPASEPELLAIAAHIQENLSAIVDQAHKALKALATTKTNIEEV